MNLTENLVYIVNGEKKTFGEIAEMIKNGGMYLVCGAPAVGKTATAKALLDTASGIVIADYINLAENPEAAADELKKFADAHNVPVVIFAQLRKGAGYSLDDEWKNPEMRDLKEMLPLAEKADAAILIARE